MKPVIDSMNFDVDEETGCWLVTGGRTKDGYKPICRSVNGIPTTFYAHIEAFKMGGGTLKDSQVVCHHCDNTQCINPWHLFAGSKSDNATDAARKGRLKTVLTREQAQYIIEKRSWARGEKKRLLETFGCCGTALRSVINGETWRWLREDLGYGGSKTDDQVAAVRSRYRDRNNQSAREKYREAVGPKKPLSFVTSYRQKKEAGQGDLITPEERTAYNQWCRQYRLNRIARLKATDPEQLQRLRQRSNELAKMWRLKPGNKEKAKVWYDAMLANLKQDPVAYEAFLAKHRGYMARLMQRDPEGVRQRHKQYRDEQKAKRNDITNQQLPVQAEKQTARPDHTGGEESVG